MTNDSPAINVIIAQDGICHLKNTTYQCKDDIIISRPTLLDGGPNTVLRFAPNKGIRIENAHRSTIKRIKILGTGDDTEGQLIGIGTNAQGCDKILFEQVDVIGGYRALWIQNSLSLLFIRCTFKDSVGPEVVKMCGGSDDTHGVDNAEFLSCNFGGKVANNNVIYMDGKVHGVKFINCPIVYGNHGIILDRSNSAWAHPKFISIIGGGFENGNGNAIKAIYGDDIRLDSMYMSTDGPSDGIYMAKSFEGRIKIANSTIRGNGRDGVRCAGGRLTVNGCDIINNGSKVTGDGVRLDGSAQDFVITGNFFGVGPDGINKQRFGICNNVGAKGVVQGNMFRGNKKPIYEKGK